MQRIFQFEINEPPAEKRLDRFLYSQIGAVSRMFLSKLIEQNACLVGGIPQPGGYKLKKGDQIEISFDDRMATAMTPENIPLEIVFEDAEIIVLNKAAGMLVHPTKNVKTGTLSNALAFHLNNSPQGIRAIVEGGESKIQNLKSKIIRPGLVHRLDKQTSGLMVAAKTERALRILSTHFERKLIKKIYFAVVEGVVLANEGIINAPIGRTNEKPHWRVFPGGKSAETRFRILEKGLETTLLELVPVTGRTNQLRIHCAQLGHPIVGDEWYGALPAPRLCLHAAKLSFYHPNGGWLAFEAKPPPEFYQS